ncbi:uncharacterized protein EV420DRAFT_1648691 [Desarmillaria tabescens]|uniref:Uncharacterized protein n=1 Tax=Armillaria tabescens TaxID=1929756 RepID=A0AA39MS49_ARMTA|nr:uncharacterized protein EV420DRAFT_1648691 [Desarmillaria tabescens]KAK0444587.1 hypothetical protein EV420DRAFT_1648691 [Desarmillaria tabescens]
MNFTAITLDDEKNLFGIEGMEERFLDATKKPYDSSGIWLNSPEMPPHPRKPYFHVVRCKTKIIHSVGAPDDSSLTLSTLGLTQMLDGRSFRSCKIPFISHTPASTTYWKDVTTGGPGVFLVTLCKKADPRWEEQGLKVAICLTLKILDDEEMRDAPDGMKLALPRPRPTFISLERITTG